MRYALTVIVVLLIVYTMVFEGRQFIYVKDLEFNTYKEVWRFDYVKVIALCVLAVVCYGKSKVKK